ncbi:hypothetical protein PoB_004456300 [Plakobranchus ocellatus]|uniref:Uncharacterized protein n=1 Tax=Plakobranchus ocellatus TaxID=259542 RepID=A0AAV4BGT9_9GAST|nr:hypothetical protein PoB_004456300 [Plakobranchus ocellatus]
MADPCSEQEFPLSAEQVVRPGVDSGVASRAVLASCVRAPHRLVVWSPLVTFCRPVRPDGKLSGFRSLNLHSHVVSRIIGFYFCTHVGVGVDVLLWLTLIVLL